MVNCEIHCSFICMYICIYLPWPFLHLFVLSVKRDYANITNEARLSPFLLSGNYIFFFFYSLVFIFFHFVLILNSLCTRSRFIVLYVYTGEVSAIPTFRKKALNIWGKRNPGLPLAENSVDLISLIKLIAKINHSIALLEGLGHHDVVYDET